MFEIECNGLGKGKDSFLCIMKSKGCINCKNAISDELFWFRFFIVVKKIVKSFIYS